MPSLTDLGHGKAISSTVLLSELLNLSKLLNNGDEVIIIDPDSMPEINTCELKDETNIVDFFKRCRNARSEDT